MKTRIKKLREEAAVLHAQATALLKEFEGKDLPDDKSRQVDQLLDEVEEKLAQARQLERAEAADTELNVPAAGARLPTPGTGDGDAQAGDDADLDAVPAGQVMLSYDPKTKSFQVERSRYPRLQSSLASIKAYRRALAYGPEVLNADERKALRADEDIAGGFLVAPQQMAQDLLKFVDDRVYVRQLATVEQLGAAASLGVVSLDTDLSDWDWTTELATGAEDTIKPFGKRALTPHPLAKRIKISKTLIRKSTRPVDTIVRDRLGYKYSVSLEKAYLTGDGFQKPLGLFTASPDGIPVARDTTYTDTNDTTRSDSIIDARYTLKAQYQEARNTRWIVSREFVKRVRKFRDANGQFMWNPGLGLQSGQPPTILDIPYLQSEFAPSTFTSGLYIALLGDLSFYWIVDSLQLDIQVLLELYAETNQIGYIGRYEGDGMPVLAEAFTRLKVA